MNTHILTGDSLAHTFQGSGIEGDIIVSREALIDGDVSGDALQEFWKTRAAHIKATYGEDEEKYFKDVAAEYEKVFNLSPSDEVYLWFEYDLFCQVNMWFVLHLLNEKGLTEIYRVTPVVRDENDLWKGFGYLPAEDLQKCFDSRVKFTKDDITLGVHLWEAYRKEDLGKLDELSNAESECFPHLKEVCAAEIERKRDMRPQKTLRKIADEGITDFKEVFTRFAETEGIYGFGDLQVKAMQKSAM